MDTNRIPKQTLRYKPKGRRNIGRTKKRWRDQHHFEDQGTGNTPNSSGTLLLLLLLLLLQILCGLFNRSTYVAVIWVVVTILVPYY